MHGLKTYPQNKKLTPHKAPRIGIVVADAREAKFYACRHEDGRLKLSPALAPVFAEPVGKDSGRHALPRVFESATPARHAIKTVDLKEEGRRRFAQVLAKKLEEACQRDSFERLILIAPAKLIGDL